MNSFGSNWKSYKKTESNANDLEDKELILVEIKQEHDIKVEPEASDLLMITRPRHYLGLINSEIAVDNDELNIEELYATHVKVEHKTEAEVGNKVGLKPEESQQPAETSSTNKNSVANGQSKKSDATPRPSNGKFKETDIGLKGRANTVINASHRKKFAAKKAEKQQKCSICDYATLRPTDSKRHIFVAY